MLDGSQDLTHALNKLSKTARTSPGDLEIIMEATQGTHPLRAHMLKSQETNRNHTVMVPAGFGVGVGLKSGSTDSTGNGLGLWHCDIGTKSQTKSVKTCS